MKPLESLMNIRHSVRTLGLVALVLPALAFAAKGDLMQITTTMNMKIPGAPAQMASMLNQTHTLKQCIARDRMTDPKTWSTKGDCTASNVHQSATGVSAHLVCRGMVGDLQVRLLPGGAVHGTMRMSGTDHGMQMTGEQTFDARRIGACDAPAPTR